MESMGQKRKMHEKWDREGGNSGKQKHGTEQMAEEGQGQKGNYRSREPKQTTHAEQKTEEKRKDR